MLDKELKQQELNRLHRLLYERDKEFEKAKGRRVIITLLVFAVGYFALLAIIGGITDIKELLSADIRAIGLFAVISIGCAWLHFWANAAIFGQLSEMGRREGEILDNIRNRIREVEKSDPH